jgi:uncharacterized protein Smg (DUF494 family)
MTDIKYVVRIVVSMVGEDIENTLVLNRETLTINEALHMVHTMSTQKAMDAFPFKGTIDHLSFTICTPEELDAEEKVVDAVVSRSKRLN